MNTDARYIVLVVIAGIGLLKALFAIIGPGAVKRFVRWWRDAGPAFHKVGGGICIVFAGLLLAVVLMQHELVDCPFAIPVAAVIGIPLYIRAETAIPIGLSLADKGMSMGAVIALIIGGAGMAIPEMSMLAGIFRKRLVVSIVGVIFATAVIGGFAFNLMIA